MGEVRDRMEQDLFLRGVAANTRETYLRYAKQFVAFHRRDARQLGTEEVRAWVMHLRRAGRAPRSINVALSALRFLFGVTLCRPEVMYPIRRVVEHDVQPTILSGSEVQRLLDALERPRDRAIVMLLYGSGLRISEALSQYRDGAGRSVPPHDQPGDIDFYCNWKEMLRRRHWNNNRRRWEPGPSDPPQRLLTLVRTLWNVTMVVEPRFEGGSVTLYLAVAECKAPAGVPESPPPPPAPPPTPRKFTPAIIRSRNNPAKRLSKVQPPTVTKDLIILAGLLMPLMPLSLLQSRLVVFREWIVVCFRI